MGELQSIYFPLSTFVRLLEIHLAEPHLLTDLSKSEFSFGTFGWEGGCLFDLAYTQDPELIPWNTVQVQNEQEDTVLTYTALLDRTLEFLATGRTEKAIRALEKAADVIPPSNLEAARLATLQYLIVQRFLAGNIGKLQSLPFLHRAYGLFFRATKDPRFSERDPLTNWIRNQLLDGYENWAWSAKFFDRISRLKLVPHTEDDQKSSFDILSESFKGVSYDELLKLLRDKKYSPEELLYIKEYVTGNFFLSSFPWSTRLDDLPSKTFTENQMAALKSEIEVIRFIDSLLAGNNILNSDPLTLHALEFIATEWPKIPDTENKRDWEKAVEQDAKAFPELRELALGLAVVENRAPNSKFLNGMNFEWWKMEYLYWFLHWSEDALVEIHEHDSPWITNYPPTSHDMRELISKFGFDCFTRDMGGKGHTFIPGLFYLTWYARTLGLHEQEQLKKKFEEETLIPFETCLSSLYKLSAQ